MPTETLGVLEDQIQKLELEADKIRAEVESHNLHSTVLNTRLDGVTLTIAQLKGFQSQLNGEEPQQSGLQARLRVDTTGIGSSQNASIGTGYDLSGTVSPESPEEGSMSRYTTHQAEFVIDWMREDLRRYGPNKSYNQRLTADYNKSFGADRSYNAISKFVTRLRKNARFDDPVSGPCERSATPMDQLQAHVGFATPPATPSKPKEFYLEFIDHCGVLIHTGNDQWFELRCHICGRNASGNSAFFKGWEGVLRHLIKAHDGFDILEDEDDIDYVLRKCTLRQVTLTEVDQIEKGLHKIEKIKKDDKYAAEQVRKSGIVAGLQPCEEQDLSTGDIEMSIETEMADELNFECSVCSCPSKPTDTPDFCPLCDWAVCMACFESGNLLDENRLAHQCFASDAMETDSQASSLLTPSDLGRWNNNFAAIELAPMLTLLDDFCPCTLSGHACKAVICSKKELCLEHVHGIHCMGKNHELHPSCPEAMEHGECTRSPLECKYMHEDSELQGHRFAISMYHECECFEH